MAVRSRNSLTGPFTSPRSIMSPISHTTATIGGPRGIHSKTMLGKGRVTVLVLAAVMAFCTMRLSDTRNWSFLPSYNEITIASEELLMVGKASPSEAQPKSKKEDFRPSVASGSSMSKVEEHSEITVRNKNPVTFDDLELLELMGHGSVSLGFTARLKGQNETFIAKISYRDSDLHFADTEIEMFGILNAPPSIPNIPQLTVAIQRIPNPFLKKFMYVKRKLGVDAQRARRLSMAKEISIIGMEFLDSDQWPETQDELRVFLRSLLFTFEFAHSRKVMMCDLHSENIYFDGKMVKLFDWNAGFVFKPDSVILDFSEAPHHLLPPEAKKGNVHRTVSGMDIWTVGRLLRQLISIYKYRSLDGTDDGNDDPVYAQILDLRDLMRIEDPYERPNATQLLAHPFFSTPDVTPLAEES